MKRAMKTWNDMSHYEQLVFMRDHNGSCIDGESIYGECSSCVFGVVAGECQVHNTHRDGDMRHDYRDHKVRMVKQKLKELVIKEILS